MFNLFKKQKKIYHSDLPAFLVKPNDPVSDMMYGSNLTPVKNKECRYYIEVNNSYQNIKPAEIKNDKNLITHIYSKEDIPSWYVVSTMNALSVRTSPLDGFVTHSYRLSEMMNIPSLMVNMPPEREISEYESYNLHVLGSWHDYDIPRKLDESKVYCHVFNLNGKVYKDYILCARKDCFAWKLECYIESQNSSMEIQPAEFAPPGFLFGGFRPL